MRPPFSGGWIIALSALVVALSLANARAFADTFAGKEAKPDHSTHDQPAKDAQGEHGKGAHEEEKPGIFPKSYDLGVWSLVIFVILFVLLQKKAWPTILENLQKREEGIRKAIDDAQKASDEAAKMRAELQKELDKAGDRVRQIMEEARKDAQQTKAEIVAEGRAEAQAERERSKREIETARDQALQEIWNQAAQLATLISAKAIGRQMSVDDHRRLVDESITDLRKAGAERRHV